MCPQNTTATITKSPKQIKTETLGRCKCGKYATNRLWRKSRFKVMSACCQMKHSKWNGTSASTKEEWRQMYRTETERFARLASKIDFSPSFASNVQRIRCPLPRPHHACSKRAICVCVCARAAHKWWSNCSNRWHNIIFLINILILFVCVCVCDCTPRNMYYKRKATKVRNPRLRSQLRHTLVIERRAHFRGSFSPSTCKCYII